MEKKNKGKNFPIFPHVSEKGFPFAIHIWNTHDEHDGIHRESPEPDITSLYSHTIERDSETIEEYGNQIYLRSWISPECLNRSKYMSMRFLNCEKIGTEEDKKNPYSPGPSNTFSKKKKTRKHDGNRHKSLHRSNERNISEGKCREIEKFPKIIENPSSSNDPEK